MRYVLTLPIILAVSCFCLHTITPVEMTHTSIGETFYRIHLYGAKNKEAPTSLNALDKREGYANSVMDGWGRLLKYTIDSEGVISILSLGRDGQIGGEGENADIEKRYRSLHEDGTFWIGEDLWIVHAEIREESL